MATEYFCGCCTSRNATLIVGIVSFVLSTSATVIALDSILIGNTTFNEDFKIEFLVIALANLFTSSCCIVGTCRESRYFLLPWLFITAIVITAVFLIALYLILFEFCDWILLGLTLLFFAAVAFYGWITAAAYYNELKTRETQPEPSIRPYLSPEAVTRPEAFVISPPPPYNMAYEVSEVPYEKPPSYEEASRVGRV